MVGIGKRTYQRKLRSGMIRRSSSVAKQHWSLVPCISGFLVAFIFAQARAPHHSRLITLWVHRSRKTTRTNEIKSCSCPARRLPKKTENVLEKTIMREPKCAKKNVDTSVREPKCFGRRPAMPAPNGNSVYQRRCERLCDEGEGDGKTNTRGRSTKKK